MRKRNKTFTVYDVLTENGFFDGNSANADSDNYQKQEYPKMLFHPTGEMRITVPAEIITTPLGAKEVGEQKELIWQIAKDEKEESELKRKGWHLNPADSTAAAKSQPVKSKDEVIAELQAQLAEAKSLAEKSLHPGKMAGTRV